MTLRHIRMTTGLPPFARVFLVSLLALFPFFSAPPPAHAQASITIDSHANGDQIKAGTIRVSGTYVDGARRSWTIRLEMGGKTRGLPASGV